MTDRERFIVRMALLYMIQNLADANDLFRDDTHYDDTMLNLNGDEGSPVSEYDVEQVLFTLQG